MIASGTWVVVPAGTLSAQLGLFGRGPEVVTPEKLVAMVKEVASVDPLRVRVLPGPMTAAEAERTASCNEYVGFCTIDGRSVCRSCLDDLGVTKAKDGREFFHYLWPPRHYQSASGEPVVDFKIARCAACGCQFSVEPCEFRLKPPAA